MKTSNPKWKKIELTVLESNQIIGIDFKLPSEVKRIKGIYTSVKGDLETEKDHINHLGELSLMVNSRQDHPLHLITSYKKNAVKKHQFQDLDIEVLPNQNITGFYIDYGQVKDVQNSFHPYTITIYMECEI